MSKHIIQIKIEGGKGSGKSKLAHSIANHLRKIVGYGSRSPISSYDNEDSYQLSDDFHIVQIRTIETRKEIING
jgi:nicotinamide riboside kinase